MSRAPRGRSRMPGRDEIWTWQLPLRRAAREPLALTAPERRRAAGFVSAAARARFIAGRTLLRRCLGRVLRCDPLAIDLVDDEDGKPGLARAELAFNVSHAGDQVLIAVSCPRRLGVDLERIRPGLDARAVTQELLSPVDKASVMRGVEKEGVRAFLRYWTRYEAVVKARGGGLRLPLGDLAQLAEGFDVRELDAPPGYVGAVAADGRPWQAVPCA